MPPHSMWPPLVALTLAATFAMLLLAHYLTAAGGAGACGAALLAWHAREPGAESAEEGDVATALRESGA
jgi:hypothetical protein